MVSTSRGADEYKKSTIERFNGRLEQLKVVLRQKHQHPKQAEIAQFNLFQVDPRNLANLRETLKRITSRLSRTGGIFK